MRFSRTLCTPALFLSAACWSYSGVPLPYIPVAYMGLKSSLGETIEPRARYSRYSKLRGNPPSDSDHTSQSYPLYLQVFGIEVVAQVTVPVTGEQFIAFDLTELYQRGSLVSQASSQLDSSQLDSSQLDSSQLEKLLSLLALKHPVIEIQFDPATQKAAISSGTSVLETEIIIKNNPRNDLPLLLEEDATRQMALAVECAQTAESLPEGVLYPCYSGFLENMGDGRLTFEPMPEYQPHPARLDTYPSDVSIQFALNTTTGIALTLNTNGTIYRGDTYSSETDTSSLSPREATSGKKGRKSGKGGGNHESSTKTVLYFSSSSVGKSTGNPGAVGGSGGEPPDDPNRKLNKPPASPVLFSNDDEESEKKKRTDTLKWVLGFEWPNDEKEEFLSSLSTEERKAVQGTESQASENGSQSLEQFAEEELPSATLPKKNRSQWGDGELRSSDQRSRGKANKDYVEDGRQQKIWDSSAY